MSSTDKWDLSHLREHLQYAVDLEFWTIPFYMSAMYSIKDRNSQAYQLIRTVVNQEMLHLQSAANICNAYGFSPTFKAPVYEGTSIPHLDFSGDDPAEIDKFKPYTAEIGPLDLEHINAMCLIEIPEYDTKNHPEYNENVTEYGSIGAFYQAVAYGASQLKRYIRGGVNQVDYFNSFYRGAPNLTVTETRDRGFDQVEMLINLITDQGEGYSKKTEVVIPHFQNTADDVAPQLDHFEKFDLIKKSGKFPDVYTAKPPSDYTPKDHELSKIQRKSFKKLRKALRLLFRGENPDNFFPIMATAGATIRNCWVNGVSPQFN